MATAQLDIEHLLDPISPDQPAGSDLRWTTDWDRIKEARRADDDLDSGKWAKKERKAADWRLAKELATSMLRDRSKDLQLALWLTEANIKLHGFTGLRDGLRVTRELMVRYWDKGLYPAMEDGPEDRGGPFEWLSNKLVDAITAIPITVRSDSGTDYSFVDRRDALRVGSQANCKTAEGELDETKKRAYDQFLADGHVSMEMFERAVGESKRADYELLYSDFEETYGEFKALERVVDEKFGDMAPNLSGCRTALNEMKQAIADILEKKRMAEPDPSSAPNPAPGPAPPEQRQHPDGADSVILRFPISVPSVQEPPVSLGGSWVSAETLIRSGEVEKGLSEMTRLAASETNGRNRFQRKFLLAEVCLATRRERLARLILEELAEQIDKFQLEFWESSELVAGVWTKLYRLYKLGAESSDLERANKLYERLCRLDPWQALGCSEG
jgi:type VI secretion system protein ImpA